MANVKDRGNGECTVFPRKDRPGVYRGQAVWNDPFTKKRTVKSFDVSNGTDRQKERAALKRAQKWLQEMQDGMLPDAEKITMDQWIDRWLNDYVKQSVRVKSYDKYAGCLYYVKSRLGTISLAQIKEPDLQRLFNWLLIQGGRKGQGLSTSTVKAIRRYLSMCFEQAVKSGILLKNVVKDTKAIKLVKQEIQVLSQEQADNLIAVAKKTGEMQYIALLLALTSGVRLGELFGLKWECINFEKKTIYIKRSLVTSTKGQLFQEPKTESSKRIIPMPCDVMEELKNYKKWQENQRFMMGDKWENNDMVLANTFGRVVDTSNFTSRYFKSLLVESGNNRNFKFHDLRHTHATLLLQKGVDISIISKRLGHSSIKMTYDTYCHILPSQQELAVKALTGIFTDPKI